MYNAYTEIFQQGAHLHRVLKSMLSRKEDIRTFFAENDYDEILFVACGSSYWASLSASMTVQEKLGVRCTPIKAGDVVMNSAYYQKAYHKPLLLIPSRSGSTSEVIQAVTLLKDAYDCKLFSLVEYENSKMKEMSDFCVEFPWVNEISVCQTRSFSAMYLSMVLVGALVGNDDALIADLDAYFANHQQHSEEAQRFVQSVLGDYSGVPAIVALGHGKQYGVAVEGAYINIEMAQLPAHYFSLLEWRHGPIVLANPDYLVCITTGDSSNRSFEENMAKETQWKGARVLSISDAAEDFENADYQICLHRPAHKETVALFSVMVMQGFAYYCAIKQKLDPDHPADLVPWIAI